MKIADPTVSFSHFEPKYKCCCGTVHVKQGALMVAIVSILMAIIGLAGILAGHESKFMAISEFLSLSIEVICIALLYLGVKRENKKLLVPFLVYEVISIVVCIVMLVVCAWAIFDASSPAGNYIRESTISEDEKELEQVMNVGRQQNIMTSLAAAFVTVAFALILLITAWFATVTYRCYGYFSDLERARTENDTAVKYEANERV